MQCLDVVAFSRMLSDLSDGDAVDADLELDDVVTMAMTIALHHLLARRSALCGDPI